MTDYNRFSCPHCGNYNRLKPGQDASQFNCGICHNSLVPKPSDLKCPSCGVLNCLQPGQDPSKFICSKCKSPLASKPVYYICPNCGIKNRLKPEHDINKANCGKCHKPMVPKPAIGTVSIICPECGENWEDSEIPGWVDCPECKFEFEVDRNGNPLDNEEEEKSIEEENPSSPLSRQGSSTQKEELDVFEFKPLLEATRPELYRLNAFRITELPVDSTQRDIQRQVEKIQMEERLGVKQGSSCRLLALNPPPDIYMLQEAIQRLNDPERRLIDEFFWFWPHQLGQGRGDTALLVLSEGNIRKAAEMWIKQENYYSENNVSMHNMAVLYHAAALDLETSDNSKPLSEENIKIRNLYWESAFRRWKTLLNHEGFWSRLTARIRDFDDPRLTTGTARKIRSSLPLALLLINAQLALQAAKNGDLSEVNRQLNNMKISGFNSDIIEEALTRKAEPTREQIKILCKNAEQDATGNPIIAQKQLIEQTATLLMILDTLLPLGSPTRDGAHDQIALQALSCLLVFINKTENWQVPLVQIKKILPLAASKSVRKKIRDNMEIINNNFIYQEFIDPIYNQCRNAISKMNEGSVGPAEQLYFLRDHVRENVYALKGREHITTEHYNTASNIVAGAFREISLYLNNNYHNYPLAYEAITLASVICCDAELSERIKKDIETIKSNRDSEEYYERQKKTSTESVVSKLAKKSWSWLKS
jgi:hypothetical protein